MILLPALALLPCCILLVLGDVGPDDVHIHLYLGDTGQLTPGEELSETGTMGAAEIAKGSKRKCRGRGRKCPRPPKPPKPTKPPKNNPLDTLSKVVNTAGTVVDVIDTVVNGADDEVVDGAYDEVVDGAYDEVGDKAVERSAYGLDGDYGGGRPDAPPPARDYYNYGG